MPWKESDTPDHRTPCPECGSVKRTCQASIGEMRPSNYLLDNFVAHRLSLLKECGAPELPESRNWLNEFILNSAFKVQLEARTRAYVFNFLRRAEGALSAYRVARVALIEYLTTPANVLSPYFRGALELRSLHIPVLPGLRTTRHRHGPEAI